MAAGVRSLPRFASASLGSQPCAPCTLPCGAGAVMRYLLELDETQARVVGGADGAYVLRARLRTRSPRVGQSGRTVTPDVDPASTSVRSVQASSRRGRRYPAGAHTAGGLRYRSDSAAMLGLGSASQNSLRALRPLRSNSCDESVYEARKRARPQAEHRSRHRNRPRRVPPAARRRGGRACVERQQCPLVRPLAGHAPQVPALLLSIFLELV